MPKKITKKPYGILGETTLSERNGGEATFTRMAFPDDKAEAERQIANLFYNNYQANLIRIDLINPPVQNREDDLDFNINDGGVEKYLELAEIAPSEYMSKGYRYIPNTYHLYEMAMAVFGEIEKKAKKYTGIGKPIILLLYITDYRFHFNLEGTILNLLKYKCFYANFKFDKIIILNPMGDSCTITQIFPQCTDWPFPFNPDNIMNNKNATVWIPDPREIKLSSDDGSLSFNMGTMPPAK